MSDFTIRLDALTDVTTQLGNAGRALTQCAARLDTQAGRLNMQMGFGMPRTRELIASAAQGARRLSQDLSLTRQFIVTLHNSVNTREGEAFRELSGTRVTGMPQRMIANANITSPNVGRSVIQTIWTGSALLGLRAERQDVNTRIAQLQAWLRQLFGTGGSSAGVGKLVGILPWINRPVVWPNGPLEPHGPREPGTGQGESGNGASLGEGTETPGQSIPVGMRRLSSEDIPGGGSNINASDFNVVGGFRREFAFNQMNYRILRDGTGRNAGCTAASRAMVTSIHRGVYVSPYDKVPNSAVSANARTDTTQRIDIAPPAGAQEILNAVAEQLKQGNAVDVRANHAHSVAAVGIRNGAAPPFSASDILIVDPADGLLRTLDQAASGGWAPPSVWSSTNSNGWTHRVAK